MDLRNEYRRSAREALAKARQVRSPDLKAAWEEIAEGWTELADREESPHRLQ